MSVVLTRSVSAGAGGSAKADIVVIENSNAAIAENRITLGRLFYWWVSCCFAFET